jgi:hydroxymethylpyrimidine/phosphomethylpyrimidine kinase
VLVIAGTDSSGGAGLARDVRALADAGVEALCAVTAVTAQTDSRLIASQPLPTGIVSAQIRAALDTGRVGAVKVGMLATGAIVRAVAEALARASPLPMVLDPVLLSSSGGMLLDEEGRREMRARLFRLATLLTPNIPEAESLCGASDTGTAESRLALARALLAQGARAVLLKGGHAGGEESTDLLLGADGRARWFSAPRIAARRRGTGCALASAIAAGIALGLPLGEACRVGKDYVRRMLSESSS